MLEIKEIRKSYGKIQAICDFSCRMGEGVYGLLGPNGSGKTTFMNILTDNIRRDGGEILFDGEKIKREDGRFRARIGYMPQYCEMIPAFSCLDFLRYMAVLKGIDRKAASAQIDSLLGKFELDDVKDRKISSLSGGMKQRLMLIQAFLGEPEIVLLDEPTAGLDPGQRVLVKNFIAEQSFGRTILLATHIIGDIEHIANGVICLKKGKTIFCGEPNVLAETARGSVWSCAVDGDTLRELKARFRVIAINSEGGKTSCRLLSSAKPTETAAEAEPTLEDAYMLLYGDEHETDRV